MQFIGPRLQEVKFFWNFMILLDIYYDSGENEVLLVKIGAKVQELRLDTSFGPKFP